MNGKHETTWSRRKVRHHTRRVVDNQPFSKRSRPAPPSQKQPPPPPSYTIIIIIMRLAAVTYALFTVVVVLFQLALTAGAPWGRYALGAVALAGRRLPLMLRTAALVQAILLLLMAEVVLVRAGWIVLYHFSGCGGCGLCCGCCGCGRRYWLTIEVVVTICAVSLLLNLITPSSEERRIWAPVAAILFFSSLTVAVLSSSSSARGVAASSRMTTGAGTLL
jgi:hypothetical protein